MHGDDDEFFIHGFLLDWTRQKLLLRNAPGGRAFFLRLGVLVTLLEGLSASAPGRRQGVGSFRIRRVCGL